MTGPRKRPSAAGPRGPVVAPRHWSRLRLAVTWAFLVPAGAYVLFAFAVPIIYNLILSFEQTSPATISHLFAPFAGLSNYKTTLQEPITQSAIIRTFIFTVLSLLFQFVIGFSLALLFNLRFPLRRFARSLIIVPWLLPLLVTGFIFRFLFQFEAGAVNQILVDLHLISHPIGFLISPGWAFVTVLITNVWIGIPFFTVLLYSALQDVPVELKEAAMIDGATAWQRLIRVTLPIIRPVIEVVFVLGFVFTVKVFDVVIGLTQGGPANSTQLLATWAYNLSFQQFDYGQGAALNTILLVIALVAAPVYIWLNRESLRRAHDMTRQRLGSVAAARRARRPGDSAVPAVRGDRRLVREQLTAARHALQLPAARLDAGQLHDRLSRQGGHIVSTLIIGLGTAILTLAIAVPAAHALARYRFRVTALLVGSLLIAQILPSIVIANSLFLVYHKLHLLNSYPGLILADASYAVPFSILVLRAFMLGLPNDVLQAARVDGARMEDVLPRRSADEPFRHHHGRGVRLPERLGRLHLRAHPAEREHVRAAHPQYLLLHRRVLREPGRGDGARVFAILPAAMLLIAAQRYIAAGLTVGSVKG